MGGRGASISVGSTGGSRKAEQLEIIKKYNPMTDDYHTGIRSVNDILTAEEAFKTQLDPDENLVYPDFTMDDAEKALKTGKIKIYSSHNIEQGTFVSTSRMMAEDYAGGGTVHEREVSINDVAWINADEGQYAQVKPKKKRK